MVVSSLDQAVWDDVLQWGSEPRSVWALFKYGWVWLEWMAGRVV